MNPSAIALKIIASVIYPKDIGHWAIEQAQLDNLKRDLRKLKVELKVYDIEEDEFPTLHSKDLFELELKSSDEDARKVVGILKKLKAFPIEEHHIVNLRTREKEIEEE